MSVREGAWNSWYPSCLNFLAHVQILYSKYPSYSDKSNLNIFLRPLSQLQPEMEMEIPIHCNISFPCRQLGWKLSIWFCLYDNQKLSKTHMKYFSAKINLICFWILHLYYKGKLCIRFKTTFIVQLISRDLFDSSHH